MASAVAGEEEHEGSRRKASLKDPEGRVISATTHADAATLLGELHNQILAGHASFADLAAKHSDYSSARLGGDLAPKSAHYIHGRSQPLGSPWATAASRRRRRGAAEAQGQPLHRRVQPLGGDAGSRGRAGGWGIGRGEFGVTYLCTEAAMGAWIACKSISKHMSVDVEDACREAEIMRHMALHPNIVTLNGTHDEDAVHHVMELCKGGELFDRIVLQGHYTERVAAALTRTTAPSLRCSRNPDVPQEWCHPSGP